jgi:hypothetical protein
MTGPGQPEPRPWPRAGQHAGLEEDRLGDPVCLLRRVCQACGSVADADPPTTCPVCGAEMPGT